MTLTLCSTARLISHLSCKVSSHALTKRLEAPGLLLLDSHVECVRAWIHTDTFRIAGLLGMRRAHVDMETATQRGWIGESAGPHGTLRFLAPVVQMEKTPAYWSCRRCH
jgi:hypothetical protein